jgi:hypothetical protein
VGAFPAFGGQGLAASGVRVAITDFGGDGQAEVVVGPGPGEPPIVALYEPLSGTAVDALMAFSPAFQVGVFVGGS